MIYQRYSGARGGRIAAGRDSDLSGRVGSLSADQSWDPRYARQSLTALWLPGVGQTNAGGGLCSQWDDRSGNGNHLTAAGAARPTINADGSLTGDGVANIMKTAAFGAAISPPYVVTMLFTPVTWTILDTIFDRLTGGPATFAAVFNAGVTPEVYQYSTITGAGVSATLGTRQVLQAVFAGNASSSLRINNNAAVTGDNGTATLDGFSLFGRNDLVNFANITVQGVSIRSANNPILNNKDTYFWLKQGGL